MKKLVQNLFLTLAFFTMSSMAFSQAPTLTVINNSGDYVRFKAYAFNSAAPSQPLVSIFNEMPPGTQFINQFHATLTAAYLPIFTWYLFGTTSFWGVVRACWGVGNTTPPNGWFANYSDRTNNLILPSLFTWYGGPPADYNSGSSPDIIWDTPTTVRFQ